MVQGVRFGSDSISPQVVDKSLNISEIPQWFRGARLNFAENLLKFRDDKTALICLG